MSLRLPPSLDTRNTALFLDLDGTLAGIEARPDDVGPDPSRARLMRRLVTSMDGRVAVLTGRTLAVADRILGSSVPAIAAVHGLVRRLPEGSIVEHQPSVKLPEAKRSLQALANDKGLLIEDKGWSVGLHYRLAPDAGEAVRAAVRHVAARTGLVVQEGSMVSELRTPGPHKGDALEAFMAEPPFAGFMPVMVGDDLTDEHAFAAAERSGGYGILVGPARDTHARYRLEGVADVLDWLANGGKT